jgi:hypothetical protein
MMLQKHILVLDKSVNFKFQDDLLLFLILDLDIFSTITLFLLYKI